MSPRYDNCWEIKEHKDEYIISILSLLNNIVKCDQHCLHSTLQIEKGPNNPFFCRFLNPAFIILM